MAKRDVKCCIACGGDTTSKSAICRKCTQVGERPTERSGTYGGVDVYFDEDDAGEDSILQSFDDPFHGRVFRDDV